jgi:hypothetical protein
MINKSAYTNKTSTAVFSCYSKRDDSVDVFANIADMTSYTFANDHVVKLQHLRIALTAVAIETGSTRIAVNRRNLSSFCNMPRFRVEPLTVELSTMRLHSGNLSLLDIDSSDAEAIYVTMNAVNVKLVALVNLAVLRGLKSSRTLALALSVLSRNSDTVVMTGLRSTDICRLIAMPAGTRTEIVAQEFKRAVKGINSNDQIGISASVAKNRNLVDVMFTSMNSALAA